MAEQLAFEERLGNRPAVHSHERTARPRARLVNGAGHQFLARAGLTEKQHREVRMGDAHDVGNNPLNDLARPHLFLERGGLLRPPGQVMDAPPQPAVDDRFVNGPNHLGMGKGFHHVVVRPRSHRRHHLRDAPIARRHDDRQVAIQLLDPLERLNAIQAWHLNVQQNHVDRFGLDDCQRLFAV